MQALRNKIIITFLSGCAVIIFFLAISGLLFDETFNTLDEISQPNPKLNIINTLFHEINQLDKAQKSRPLELPGKPFPQFQNESNHIFGLLDTLKLHCIQDTGQMKSLNQMQKLLSERNNLFFVYQKFRVDILKNRSISKDIRVLSEFINQNVNPADSGVVKTTKNSIVTTTYVDLPAENKPVKKQSFFKRLFSRKKTEQIEPKAAVRKIITENVEIKIDTFGTAKQKNRMTEIEETISKLAARQHTKNSLLIKQEIKLSLANAFLIDELQKLLREVQKEEISELQHKTEALADTFNSAFERGAAILLVFLVLTVVLILMMFSDISQSNKYKTQLIAAKEKAEQLEQIKHRFLSNMSHEIRTPLQVIIGFSEQMNSGQNPEATAAKAISRSSEYLLQIVNEILDYNRIVSGKFTLVKDPFNIEVLVAEVADIMGSQAEKKNLRFKFKSRVPEDGFYLGDPFRLKQILFNLLANAIKFTEKGYVAFSTDFREINKHSTEFIFEVEDTGIGMSEEAQKHIFEPFEQANESIERKYGGTGLGLAIVKSILNIINGSIKVSSEVNCGSSFRITCVFEKSHDVKEQSASECYMLPVANPGKVLIVDDDKFILQLCETIFRKNNIEHVCCSAPEELLSGDWDQSVTVVLIDMRMPTIGGIELFRHIKNFSGPDVRFIALTALALPEEEQWILTMGFDTILLKPFREKDLLNAVLKTGMPVTSAFEILPDSFDVSSIWQMCENDEKLFNKNIQMFVDQTSQDLNDLENAAHKQDVVAVSDICHRLSAKVAQVRFNSLYVKLKTIEYNAKQLPGFHLNKTIYSEIKHETEMVMEKMRESVIV